MMAPTIRGVPPTCQNRLDPTQFDRVRLDFRDTWVGLQFFFFFFDCGSGWVQVIKFQTHQIQPDPPINLKYII